MLKKSQRKKEGKRRNTCNSANIEIQNKHYLLFDFYDYEVYYSHYSELKRLGLSGHFKNVNQHIRQGDKDVKAFTGQRFA